MGFWYRCDECGEMYVRARKINTLELHKTSVFCSAKCRVKHNRDKKKRYAKLKKGS